MQSFVSYRQRSLLKFAVVILLALPTIVTYAAGSSNSWTITGDVRPARQFHTSTLLLNGKILVAGGLDGNGDVVSSAMLYDPSSGTWAATGSLHTARYHHTATLLTNGTVLVAGGVGGPTITHGQLLSSAELYDPRTGKWTGTGSLRVASAFDGTTLLLDGTVLVVQQTNKPSTELYNPATGTWSFAATRHHPSNYPTVTRLHNGDVLVTGGEDPRTLRAVATAEVYHPLRGTWSDTGSMTQGRQYHTMTRLHSGNVLVTGGEEFGATFSTTKLYDPRRGTWTPTGSMTAYRENHTATLLPNGRVLVAAGYGSSVAGPPVLDHALASAEVYDPKTGTWMATADLHAARFHHTATRLFNGEVVVIGGTNNVLDALGTSERYEPSLLSDQTFR